MTAAHREAAGGPGCGRRPAFGAALAAARVASGFLVPALVWGTPWAAAAALLGDLLDRCEFYGELEIPSPEAGMNLHGRP